MQEPNGKQRQLNRQALLFRKPSIEDGAAVYSLVSSSPPLDLNSSYSYFMFCSYFRDTSVVAVVEGKIAGYISGFLVPARSDTLFVWQVAVDSGFRKMGIANKMLNAILERGQCLQVRYIETTVTPSNTASEEFFSSYGRMLGADTVRSLYVPADLFPAGNHEEEVLFRIGPIEREKKIKETNNENI